LQGVFIYLLFRASSNRHKLKTPRHLRVEAFVPRTGIEPAHPCER
jgi:hypothetical protein